MRKVSAKQALIMGSCGVALIIATFFGIQALQSKLAADAEQQQMSRGFQNLGQIREFSLPPNWRFVSKDDGAQSYDYIWKSNSEPEACIEVEGPPDLPTALQDGVMSVLSQPSHFLTPEELQLGSGVDRLLRRGYRAGSYDLIDARTIDIDGKKVIRAKRKFKDPAQGVDDSLIINADGIGKSFQVVRFSGSDAAYNAHRDEAEKSFKSLRLDLDYLR